MSCNLFICFYQVFECRRWIATSQCTSSRASRFQAAPQPQFGKPVYPLQVPLVCHSPGATILHANESGNGDLMHTCTHLEGDPFHGPAIFTSTAIGIVYPCACRLLLPLLAAVMRLPSCAVVAPETSFLLHLTTPIINKRQA